MKKSDTLCTLALMEHFIIIYSSTFYVRRLCRIKKMKLTTRRHHKIAFNQLSQCAEQTASHQQSQRIVVKTHDNGGNQATLLQSRSTA